MDYDLAIAGGGASGLVAAITAKELRPELRVVLIEKNGETGRKIKATGNGRCNLSNTGAEGNLEVLAFFKRMGMLTRTYENGLIYPQSESAEDVARLLYERASEAGCEIMTGTKLLSVGKKDGLFVLKCEKKDGRTVADRVICAAKVILATGGKAAPTFGTTGDGYAVATELGHTVVKPIPVLAGVECIPAHLETERSSIGPLESLDLKKLSGIRSKGKISLFKKDESGTPVKCFEEDGEIQFTIYGLSGICVFNMTRFMRLSGGRGMKDFIIEVDLYREGDIRDFIRDRRHEAEASDSAEKVRTLLRTVVKENLADYVISVSGIKKKTPIKDLKDEDIESIAKAVHSLRFVPVKIRGWKEAQCTSGGVALDEIDEEACESKIEKGLFFAGEITDYDGPCGGFNLNHAWLTGMRAARAAVSGDTGDF